MLLQRFPALRFEDKKITIDARVENFYSQESG